MSPPSSTVARLELATILSTRRREIGRDAREVFEALSISRNHLSAIENGRTLPTEELLRGIAGALQLPDETTNYLVRLREVAQQPEWWDDYARTIPAGMIEFCGLEYGAEAVRVYEPSVVTGLLQTEAYARAVIGANPTLSRLAVDRMVEFRMRRQDRLHGEDPLHLAVIQGETAITQEIGSRAVLKGQLEHILSLLERSESTIDYRIVPFSSPRTGFGVSSTTIILDFTTRYLTTVAWIEGPFSLDMSDDPEIVKALDLSFQLASTSCLDRSGTIDLIQRRLAELK